MTRTNQKNRLEDIYALGEDYFQPPNISELRPGLIAATVRHSREDRLLKIWWKTGGGMDSEFRELWNHERLQIGRVMNYPDADEVIVGVIEMIETSDSFCAVCEAGPTPLAARVRTLQSRHWLNSLGIPSNRIILWSNLARLAKALGIIHAQGLIHGRIDRFAAFTEGSASPDFKLGGFEWSVGIDETQPRDPLFSLASARIDRLIYSYADDWKALGALFADLLGLDRTRLREDDPFRTGQRAIDLSDVEIDFLRRLVDPLREDALDARSIARTVETLGRELVRFHATKAARFVLLIRLSAKMSEAIERATDGDIGVDEPDRQIAFIEGDLAAGAKLIVSDRDDLTALETITLVTEILSYQLRQFTDDGPATWQMATVVSVMLKSEVRLPSDREAYPLPHEIVVVRNKADALAAVERFRDQAVDWVVPITPTLPMIDNTETHNLRQAVLLVQVVEALIKTLDVLPIEVISRRREGGRTTLSIVSREGTARDILAIDLNQRTTVEVLDQLFDKDDLGIDVDWRLSASGTLSSRLATEIKARFVSVTRSDTGAALYEFDVFDVLRDEKNLFLRRSGDAGTEALIRRRLRTTRRLRDQRDLVAFFLDPRRGLKSSNEPISEDAPFSDLDEPKQEALRAIWTTLPNHLVVGPPGVGKTRLSAELVRRRLDIEPASRILVSAQSHQALDHLLDAVRKKALVGSSDAIVVRSRGSDDAASTDQDVRKIALSYLDRVLGSSLLLDSPASIGQNLHELKTALQRVGEADEPGDDQTISRREEAGLRALEALVLESANVVFSTSNSRDIERLGEDGAQFDWAIIEEAAKATGPELVAPLSLSGRRLLIGDHNQLPPFDAERLRAILENKTAIRKALDGADEIIGSTFFESGLDDLQVALQNEDTLDLVSQLALRMLQPFRSLVEEDERRRAVAGGQKRSITSELLIQHRMDPAIALLISRCFYNGRLDTSAKRREEAKNSLPFTFGREFPTSPIVFVDMPFASRTGKAEPVESGRPRWHNPSERQVVSDLLRQLRLVRKPEIASTSPVTVAVLSPYRAQVERMQPVIESLRSEQDGRFLEFAGFTHDGRVHGTVDSAQGSEADLVIVSLVRNNQRSGLSALGFLRDSRRMNVLLSRSRLQLILIGSLEFLRESTRLAPAFEQNDLDFVRIFLSTLDELTKGNSARGGPSASILTLQDLYMRLQQ
jgi:hypothetical protein